MSERIVIFVKSLKNAGRMELFWFVGYTKPSHESTVADYLIRQGIEVYLPIQKLRRKWSDRTKIVDVKVLPGKIFIHTTKQQRVQLLRDFPYGSLRGFMSNGGPGNPLIIPDCQLETFRMMVDGSNENLVNFITAPLRAGDKVRITTGAFRDFECVLTEVQGKKCMAVSMGALGTATLEISLDSVERLVPISK